MRLWINDDVLENGLPSEAVTDNINKALLSNSGQTVTTLMRFGIRRDLQYQMDNFYLVMFLIFLSTGGFCFLMCCCTSFCVAADISNQQNNNFTNTSPIESNERQQSATERTNDTSSPLTEQEREERRADILMNVVTQVKKSQSSPTEIWKDNNSSFNTNEEDRINAEGTTFPSSTRSFPNLFQQKKSSNSDYNDDVCAICLEGYKENDEICSSKIEICPHKFHLDCMVGWLMDHDECPVCRVPYLVRNPGRDASSIA